MENWLKEHLLTRADGLWLSDRRDPVPLERRRWQTEKNSNDEYRDWKWSILPKDFDDALMIQGSNPKKIAVHGFLNVSEGSRKETISIRSAAVTSKTSFALLRALQTIDNSWNFSIPNSHHHMEVQESGFQMMGWVYDPYSEYGLDKFDESCGLISWPVPQPSKLMRRNLELTSDKDKRTWFKDDISVMDTELWGDHRERQHQRAENYGSRIVANIDFTLNILNQLDHNLIFEVQIERENGYKDEDTPYAHRKYSRIYLLTANGELHTLYGHRVLREQTRQRIRA